MQLSQHEGKKGRKKENEDRKLEIANLSKTHVKKAKKNPMRSRC